MGGQGSGRPPGAAAIVKRFTPQITPVIAQPGNLTLPPTIHLQEAAKKGTAFKFPITDGTNTQVMITDGSGNLIWADQSGAGGGVTSVFTRTGDVVAATNDYTWAQINKTTSDIANITTKSHTSLSDIGTTTHANIDTHIASGSIHFLEGAISHTNITNVGTNTHAQIDTHIASGSIHFLESAINHTAITNIGTNTHAQVDTHIASGSIHFTATSVDHDATTNFVANEHIDWTGASAGTIHSTNYVDNNTTYTGGTNLTLSDTTFNVDDAFLVNNASDTTTGTITAAGFATAGTATIGTQLIHDGDTDTYIQFDADVITLRAGGVDAITITEAAADTIVFGAYNVKTATDFTASGSEMFRNVLIGTEATPPTASSVSQGTLYVQYTA